MVVLAAGEQIRPAWLPLFAALLPIEL